MDYFRQELNMKIRLVEVWMYDWKKGLKKRTEKMDGLKKRTEKTDWTEKMDRLSEKKY